VDVSAGPFALRLHDAVEAHPAVRPLRHRPAVPGRGGATRLGHAPYYRVRLRCFRSLPAVAESVWKAFAVRQGLPGHAAHLGTHLHTPHGRWESG